MGKVVIEDLIVEETNDMNHNYNHHPLVTRIRSMRRRRWTMEGILFVYPLTVAIYAIAWHIGH